MYDKQNVRHTWDALLEADRVAESLRIDLLRGDPEEVAALLRDSLRTQEGMYFAFRLLLQLPSKYRQALFKRLVDLACQPTSATIITKAREVLLTLPRPWVVDQLRATAKDVLEGADYWIWSRFLELVAFFDRDFVLELAKHALENSDEEVREVGRAMVQNPSPPSWNA
jgi:hypothetical protein